MRQLNDKQISERIANFKSAYEKLFLEPAPMTLVRMIMENHLHQIKKDYILKYLGDYSQDSVKKIVDLLKEDSSEQSIPVPDIGPRQITFNQPGPTAAVEQAREDAAKSKIKRKRRKRSDAGKPRKKS